ncbi:family 16 glycoside hydrolase [Lacipirellula limnantheis]|uniref:Calcineurin-like phosphoesterase n=1 Tax=Lacipirellula limnantheis TaxID=2528024 RepID=A0A517TR67_9BACT|nr:family 16 glycoside hydrolase [Lacipirellula limnantheis]QDT70860.1 Calcineurin-like phosphoesterase [Lacipirellula limnantheis]
MDRRQFLVASALTPAISLVAARLGYAAEDDGWIQLFNGKDLNGWTPKIRGHELGVNYADTFRVEDGVIKVAYDKYEGPFRGRYGHLFYQEPFSNYLLRIEYRFVGEQAKGGPGWATRNSGVMIHGQDPKEMTKDQEFPVSIEVQFLGGDGMNPRNTGNLCTPGTNVVMDGELHTPHCTNSSSDTFHGDQWVTAEIEVHGGKTIRHKINGKTVLEYSEPQLDPADANAKKLLDAGAAKIITGGTISLQSESHPVEFRKVELKPLLVEGEAQSDPLEPCDPVELAEPGSFMIVALPDTQVYAMHPKWNHHFHNQTQWIVDNAERLNIKYVLHEGDITNNNVPEQWEVARAAMGRLDGKVPYALAPGNHDYGPNGSSTDRSTMLNDYFSAEELAKFPGFGGAMAAGKLENSYHTFEANGKKYLILALEWGPRDEAVAWADKIVSEHPDHQAILLTHAYMYYDDTRYDWKERGEEQTWNPHAYGQAKLPGGVNDGQELWDKLVKKHPGFIMTLNGHVLEDGAGRTSTKGDAGNMVHQMLANYQNRAEGGEGYMRLIEFSPDGKTIRVRSYSPSTKMCKVAEDQQFTLEL